MGYKLLSSLFYSDKKLYEETYNKRLNSESTYNFDFKIGKYNAFIVINNDILERVDRILDLDKKLLFCMKTVPPIALNEYRRKCLIDEIKMTNDIEGVHSTRKEINDILNDNTQKSENKRLYGIVKKYEMIINDENINLKTCQGIRDLYNEFTLKDVVNENKDNKPDGAIFRNERVYVYNDKQEIIHRGISPENEIIKTMSSCLDALNDSKYNFLIRVAMFHYMFGYIHPFYDGNGRTSRFISSYLLCQRLEYLVAYRLSYTIRQNIKKYYKSFAIVNDEKNRGDLTSFIITFFDLIIESIKDLCASLIERKEKLEYYEEIIDNMLEDNKSERIIYILVQNELFGDYGLSINDLHYASNISESKVRKIIKEFDRKGLISIKKVGNKHIYNVKLEKLIELFEDEEVD